MPAEQPGRIDQADRDQRQPAYETTERLPHQTAGANGLERKPLACQYACLECAPRAGEHDGHPGVTPHDLARDRNPREQVPTSPHRLQKARSSVLPLTCASPLSPPCSVVVMFLPMHAEKYSAAHPYPSG